MKHTMTVGKGYEGQSGDRIYYATLPFFKSLNSLGFNLFTKKRNNNPSPVYWNSVRKY